MREKYIDFDLEFTMLNNGDVARRVNEYSVHDGIRNLFMLMSGDKHYNHDIGIGVKQLLFMQMQTTTEIALKQFIEDSIKNFEPRAKITSENTGIVVEMEKDSQQYRIEVTYAVDNDASVFTYVSYLSKIR